MTTKTFPAKVEVLSDVLGFVEPMLQSFGCSSKIQTAVCVAVEEVFVNIAHYSYGDGNGEVDLSVSFDEESSTVTFVIADMGVPFNPLEKPQPDITLSAENRNIGGLGIFITRKIMDHITYTCNNGKNVLTMLKRI